MTFEEHGQTIVHIRRTFRIVFIGTLLVPLLLVTTLSFGSMWKILFFSLDTLAMRSSFLVGRE